MRQRGVPMDWVRRTLLRPDETGPDRQDNQLRHALKRFYHRGRGTSVVLRVVYNHVASPWRVVTVFFDRVARKRK
jgi:hypothetical protein